MKKIPIVDRVKLEAFLACFSVLTETVEQAGDRKLSDEMERWKQRAGDKGELEQNILLNMNELILPFVEKLKKGAASTEQTHTIDILESNLREITSPVIGKMRTLGLSPRESTVASLIKEGRSTKQIAGLLGVSDRAVEFHRYNIRKKLGLEDKKTDLRTHLLSMT